MVTIEEYRTLATSFDGVKELPHFDKTSFRAGSKIYCTLNEKANRGCVKLSEKEQDIFSLIDANKIYPVPNKWGKQGWTNINLAAIDSELLYEVLFSAYLNVAPKNLTESYLNEI